MKFVSDKGGVYMVILLAGHAERGKRKRQKGVICSVEGCDAWCVSNGLCSKHNMRERRKQEKYKAYIKEYNKKYKRTVKDKVCELCGGDFVTAREEQVFCSGCSGGDAANRLIQKRYRVRNKYKER